MNFLADFSLLVGIGNVFYSPQVVICLATMPKSISKY